MSWLAVDESGAEVIYNRKPARRHHSPGAWGGDGMRQITWVLLPQGSIERLIGRRLTWKDEPVNLVENNAPVPGVRMLRKSKK